jgi:hypothetical protein
LLLLQVLLPLLLQCKLLRCLWWRLRRAAAVASWLLCL